jgi:uncharacterized protein (UPF0248 family)
MAYGDRGYRDDRGGGGYHRGTGQERPSWGGYPRQERRDPAPRTEYREEPPERPEYRKYDTLVSYDGGFPGDPAKVWGNFVDIVDDCIVLEGHDLQGDPVEYQIPMHRVFKIRKRTGAPNGTVQPGPGK